MSSPEWPFPGPDPPTPLALIVLIFSVRVARRRFLITGLEFRARVGSEAKGSILVHGFWFLGFVFWWVCFGFWICDGLRDKCVIFIGMRMDFGYDLYGILFIDDQIF